VPSYTAFGFSEANAASFGGVNWDMWLFQFVDDFRRNPSLLAIPDHLIRWPSPRDAALFHAVCSSLLDEVGVPQEKWPTWLSTTEWLPDPWFLSGMESLKATAILESPVWFRRNNIWVFDNFLNRV
jgi:hypothetical protein